MRNTLSRRTLLEGLALGTAGTLLPSIGRQARAAGEIPKRFVVFYTQHGTLPWLWRPTGSRTDFKMGPLLEPLEMHKQDLILLGGIDMKGLDQASNNAGCGHARGQAGSLTASTQLNGKRGNGPSIDYHIAQGFKANNGGTSPTPLQYLHAGILDKSPNLALWGQPYHSGPGQLLPIEYNPANVLKSLFPNGMAPTPTQMVDTKAIARRRGVLGFLNEEYRAVGDAMGKFEKERLEQHADLLSDLSSRIDKQGNAGAGCALPMNIKPNSGGAGWWGNTSDAMPRLLQAAFACDRVRVMCLQVEEPAPSSYGYTPGNFGTNDLHDLVHKLDVGRKDANDANRLEAAKRYYRHHAELFAKVLGLLKDIKEADGKPMLHHTAVLWAGEIAQPGHSYHNNKWIVAGQAGGYLKTGQFLDLRDDGVYWEKASPATNHSNSDLFITLANAVGVKTTAFGAPGSFKGEIADIKA